VHCTIGRMKACQMGLGSTPKRICALLIVVAGLASLEASLTFLSPLAPRGHLPSKFSAVAVKPAHGTNQVRQRTFSNMNSLAVPAAACAALLLLSARRSLNCGKRSAHKVCSKPRVVVFQADPLYCAQLPGNEHPRLSSSGQSLILKATEVSWAAPSALLDQACQTFPPSRTQSVTMAESPSPVPCASIAPQSALFAGQFFPFPCCSVSRRVGRARRKSRMSGRASKSAFAQTRADRRSLGSRLHSHCKNRPLTLSYDPSYLRTQIQMGLQTSHNSFSASVREVRTISAIQNATRTTGVFIVGRHFRAIK